MYNNHEKTYNIETHKCENEEISYNSMTYSDKPLGVVDEAPKE